MKRDAYVQNGPFRSSPVPLLFIPRSPPIVKRPPVVQIERGKFLTPTVHIMPVVVRGRNYIYAYRTKRVKGKSGCSKLAACFFHQTIHAVYKYLRYVAAISSNLPPLISSVIKSSTVAV